MAKILTDDEVVQALAGIVDEETVRTVLASVGRLQDNRQYWLVERIWHDGTRQVYVRQKRKKGHVVGKSLRFRERVAQLPPLDRLEWTETVERVRE